MPEPSLSLRPDIELNVSNLGLVELYIHCEVAFKADVLLCRYSESTNSMHIDTEKELECSLSMVMNMRFSCKMG